MYGVKSNFSRHFNSVEDPKMSTICEKFLELVELIDHNLVDCPEKSIVFTKLEEAAMWTDTAALNGLKKRYYYHD